MDLWSGDMESWMDDWSLFVTDLQQNFRTIDPIGDAEDKIDSLWIKDNQRIIKYNVDFNQLASRLHWGDSAFGHKYYSGLPDCIKDINMPTLALATNFGL